jgi:hypothetical protein
MGFCQIKVILFNEYNILLYLIILCAVEIDHLGDPGVDVWIILKWIFKKWDDEAWTGLIWLRIGTDGGRL